MVIQPKTEVTFYGGTNFDDGNYGRMSFKNVQDKPLYINTVPRFLTAKSVSVNPIVSSQNNTRESFSGECTYDVAEMWVGLIILILILYILVSYYNSEK